LNAAFAMEILGLILTLYREIIAVYSEIHTKHTNTLFGNNSGLLKLTVGGTYNYHRK
jgi:hypothetical protein